jgi:hypothetical protein
VDELLIYPRRRTALVALSLLGVFVVWAAVILYDHHGLHHIGYSDGKLLVFAPIALVIFLNNVRQINSGLPRLRISNDGIEGRFGLLAWPDVAQIEKKFRWGWSTAGSRIVVTMRAGATVRAATREFAGGPGLAIDRVYEDRVEIVKGGMDRSLDEVMSAIRRRAPRPRGLM